MHNFPASRGLVIGLGKSFNGLGASVLSCIYSAFYADSNGGGGGGESGRGKGADSAVSRFLLLLSLLQLFIPLAFALVCAKLPQRAAAAVAPRPAPGERRRLGLGFLLSLALALSLTAGALASSLAPQQPDAERYALAALTFALLLGYSLIPCGLPLLVRVDPPPR